MFPAWLGLIVNFLKISQQSITMSIVLHIWDLMLVVWGLELEAIKDWMG